MGATNGKHRCMCSTAPAGEIQAEDMLLTEFVVTFCALLSSYCCQCTLMTEVGNGVNGTKPIFLYIYNIFKYFKNIRIFLHI